MSGGEWCSLLFLSDWNPGLIYISITFILRWIIFVIAIYLPLIGGSLLIIDGVLLVWLTWGLIGLPYLPLSLLLLASGVLFILSWILIRKRLMTRDD